VRQSRRCAHGFRGKRAEREEVRKEREEVRCGGGEEAEDGGCAGR